MKIRSGFVSNSSSSSFIVIAPCANESLIAHLRNAYNGMPLVVDACFGRTEYGWEYEESNDFGSKVIFSYIQAVYMVEHNRVDVGQKWIAMLERVLRDNTGCSDIWWNVTTKYDSEKNKLDGKDHAYIDHQSASYEGENTEMFDSEQSLYNFLFNESSNIQTGNDNG